MAEVRGASPLNSIYSHLMDERIRELERQAKAGDLDAAQQWMVEADRAGDKLAWFEAFKLVGELQYPGMMETMRQLEELDKLTGPPYVDDPGVWSNEIVLRDDICGASRFVMRDDCGPTGVVFK